MFKSGGRTVGTRGVMADTGADVAYAGGTPIGSSIRQLKILPSGFVSNTVIHDYQ